MILIAGIRDADIDRVKALLPEHAFPDEQAVIDTAFAKGDMTVPEFAKALRALRDDHGGPCGFGSGIAAGFFSAYLTMFPDSEVVVVKSDPRLAVDELIADGHDAWACFRGVVMGYESIMRHVHDVPHVEIDMIAEPTDDEIIALLAEREPAA